MEGKHEFPKFVGALAWDSFVVLDTRSIADSTCEVHHRFRRMPADSDEGEWDDAKVIKTWKVFRVKFLTAWFFIQGLEMGDDETEQLMDGRNQYVDETGVLQFAWYEQNTHEFPVLENRAPYGPGDNDSESAS